MERKAIATVRLAPGRAGFYDPLSRVHLTVGRPKATIYAGTNCASLRRNVKAGVIRLEEGTLGADVPPLKLVPKGDGTYHVMSNAAEEMKPVYAEATSAKAEEPKEEPKAEEANIDESEKEAPVEEKTEEAPAEEAKSEDESDEEASEKEESEDESSDEEESDDSADAQPEKKRRGRPRKNSAK